MVQTQGSMFRVSMKPVGLLPSGSPSAADAASLDPVKASWEPRFISPQKCDTQRLIDKHAQTPRAPLLFPSRAPAGAPCVTVSRHRGPQSPCFIDVAADHASADTIRGHHQGHDEACI